jgi:hypothetical protein
MSKRVGAVFLAVVGGISMPLLVWVAGIAALYQIFSEWRTTRTWLMSTNLTCNINADCPPGYQCIGGRCAPARSE